MYKTGYQRAAARAEREEETYRYILERPLSQAAELRIHPRLTLIRLRALISWSRTPSQYTSAAARADIEQ